jgi:hypothetical protein
MVHITYNSKEVSEKRKAPFTNVYDGNARAALREYKLQYPDRRQQDRYVLTTVHSCHQIALDMHDAM